MTSPDEFDHPFDPACPPLTGRAMMNQDWRDLTFLHWAVPPERVASFMPPESARTR